MQTTLVAISITTIKQLVFALQVGLAIVAKPRWLNRIVSLLINDFHCCEFQKLEKITLMSKSYDRKLGSHMVCGIPIRISKTIFLGFFNHVPKTVLQVYEHHFELKLCSLHLHLHKNTYLSYLSYCMMHYINH